ncbi:sialidase family protein [Methylobrevis pamukkalensis]|uniref:BNR/Asp-box repeat protein n=1 Tax=Methylobrevis pamukkalensis TaxID=1439726 RepID=A0A1E3H3Z6_9HYPH|nr:exo-alpha-sialidase [Methylobrevis pamukkalensis]ODN71024.1 BNR/Asp-box repeat protein [Methylobrevis pamukkalensis]
MPADAPPMDGLLRPAGLDGVTEACLPSPCVQNHAANLALLADGSLACVWFGGTMEGASDICVHLSRLAPGAAGWSPAERMSGDPARSEQNPVLFTAPDGRVWLIWTAQRAGNQDTAIVRRRISADGGLSFGPEEVFIDTAGTFVRQPVVVTAAGTWLLPIFRCRTVPGVKWSGDNDDSAVLRSTDGGATWATIDVPASTGCVHMNIVDLGEGGLVAVFRSRWADAVYLSRSFDDGRNWSAPEPTDVPNNNSSIQMIRLSSGALAMVCNPIGAAEDTARRVSLYDEIEDEDDAVETVSAEPSSQGRKAFWGTPRAPLSILLSDDGGRSWPARLDLATGDGYCLTNNSVDGLNREFSYPSVVEGADGTIHVAFTHHRRAIRHMRVTERMIRGE